MVVFGASGDLTRRKLMPALFRLEVSGDLPEGLRVVGFARTAMDDARFRCQTLDALSAAGVAGTDPAARERFVSRLSYVTGRYDDTGSLSRLREHIGGFAARGSTRGEVHYLALPPSVMEAALECMKASGFVEREAGAPGPRIMVEKPFGADLASARRLNALLSGMFPEGDVYRIDHYLAKDTVRNLLILRFANAVFEPLWDRKHVDCVQITAAEEIGIEGRGSYYEEAGVVRDMVQNHVMQVLALIAMEAPLAGDAESVRDRKVEVFRSLAPLGEGDFVFGQYRGYRGERGVRAESSTPTFAALRLSVRNWRWQGVPFYVRAGKRLARKVTDVVVRFRDAPLCVVGDETACAAVRPNALVIRIQPDEGMRLTFNARLPGRHERLSQANLDFRYADLGVAMSGGYEQVLLDGIEGRPSLFWRADGIEAAWRAVEPLLKAQDVCAAATFPNYDPGSWGPPAADELLAREGHEWLPSY
jgi:glucose-6-phosphate 1-dehydrogenase